MNQDDLGSKVQQGGSYVFCLASVIVSGATRGDERDYGDKDKDKKYSNPQDKAPSVDEITDDGNDDGGVDTTIGDTQV